METKIYAMSQDPIHIGTGGYTIGRVDNTIVRDPITQIPKIPGSSLAGTWRYYMALTIQSYFQGEFRYDRRARANKDLKTLFKTEANSWVKEFEGNRYAAIKCAGQDDIPNLSLDESAKANLTEDAEHCGHCGCCLVCTAFGFSKRDKSKQGLVYFSDLNIVLFPVYTRFGTRWITSPAIIANAIDDNLEWEFKLKSGQQLKDDEVIVFDDKSDSINLGWLNLKGRKGTDVNSDVLSSINNLLKTTLKDTGITKDKSVIVSDNLIAQVIKSNLEVRTSVSIDPITGAAKKGALFTSEAIPRATVFYGNIRIGDEPLNKDFKAKQGYILDGLKESQKYFESLGIGGMTTRGFGRLKIFDWGEKDGSKKSRLNDK